MRIVTTLMDKVFSDSTPSSFGDELQAAIQKAMSEGHYSCVIDGDQYNFADCGDGSCVIEDKSNKNELTLAKENSKGETVLNGVEPSVKSDSPTLKDVVSKRTDGEDGKGNLPSGITQPNADASVVKTEGIVDADKAGVGKALNSNFSLCIHGFDTEEEANQFYSDMMDVIEGDEDTLTFSDTEVENVVFSANQLALDVERLMGTEDLQLAYSIVDTAESLKAYCILADDYGHDTAELYDALCAYSDYASDVIESTIENTDINEYFSQLDEDEINDYFSGLDEVSANVLYSALMDEENTFTFSEVQEVANEVKSEMKKNDKLDTPVKEVVDTKDGEELKKAFSDLNLIEQNIVFSMLEEDENTTFSELNEALSEVNIELTELFSDATEDEVEEFCSMYSDEEIEVLENMLYSEDTYTYSDFLSFVEDNRTFSEDDIECFAENLNQLYSAVEDMTDSDTDLAGQILFYSEQMSEVADEMKNQGHDTDEAKKKLEKFSEKATEVLDKNGVDPAAALEKAAKEEELKKEDPAKAEEKSNVEKKDKEEPKKEATKAKCDENKPENQKTQSEKTEESKVDTEAEFNKIDTNKDGVISKDEWEAAGKSKEDFDRIDTNKDGKISKDEFKNFSLTEEQLDFSCFESIATPDVNIEDGNKVFSMSDMEGNENENMFLDTPIN